MTLTANGRGVRAAALAVVPLALLAVLFAWPLAATIHRAVWGGGIGGAAHVPPFADVASALGTTLWLAAAGTVLALAVGLPATWALYRRPWSGSRLVSTVLEVPFVLPTVVVALAVLALTRDAVPSLAAADGMPGIVLALGFFNIAVVLRFVGPSLEAFDERQDAAARTLGASRRRSAWHVVWPQARRAVGNAAAVTFLFCASSFALVLLIGGTRVRTLETSTYLELTAFANVQGAAIYAGMHALVVASIAVAVSRVGRKASAGRVHEHFRAHRTDAPWIWLMLAPAIAVFLAPMVALVLASLHGPQGWTLANYAAAISLQPAGPGLPSLGMAALRSVALATAATLVAFILGTFVVGAGFVSHRWRWLRVAATAPLAVSSVVVGVGLLLGVAVHLRPVTSATSAVLLVCAQVLIALPLVVRILALGADALDPGLVAAARTLGAHGWRLVLRTVAPLMKGSVAAALGLAFAVAVGEFGASAFLAGPASPTLPTAIARTLARPGSESLGIATAGGLILGLIAGAAMLLARGIRHTRRQAT